MIQEYSREQAFDAGVTLGAGCVMLATTAVYAVTPVFDLPTVFTPAAAWTVTVGLFVVGAVLKRSSE